MLNSEDRDWIENLESGFAGKDKDVPALVAGSAADEVRAFLAPYMTAEIGVLKEAMRLFMLTMVTSSVTQEFCAGMVKCPRCGDVVASRGGSPRVVEVACGTCKRLLECRLIEYSPRVGRQIVRVAQEHADTVALLNRASELRAAGSYKEAIDHAGRAVDLFRERGLRVPCAGALLERAKSLEAGGDQAQAHDARAQVLQILFELKSIASLVRALLRIAIHEFEERDAAVAAATLSLIIDIVSAHDPELETTADAAVARFIQATIASNSLNTLDAARRKFAEALAFLTDAANRPGGRKLLNRGIEERFSKVYETINKDHSELVDLANNMQAALEAQRHDVAHFHGSALFERLTNLADRRSMLAIASKLVQVNTLRKDLGQVLEYLKAMTWLANGRGDAGIRAGALRTQGRLEEVLSPEAAPGTFAKAEAVERVLEAARIELTAAKSEAQTALDRNDVASAAKALARAANAAETLGEKQERLQILMQWESIELAAKRWGHALQVSLEVEAIAASTPAVAQALTNQARALAALGDVDAGAVRMARAKSALHSPAECPPVKGSSRAIPCEPPVAGRNVRARGFRKYLFWRRG